MTRMNPLRRKREERIAYWLLLGPALAVYLLVMAFPTLMSLILSFSNYNGGTMFDQAANPWGLSGFDRYLKLAADPQFWVSLKNNFYLIAISVFGQIPLGFGFAYLIYRRLVRAPGFWQGLLYLPAIISTIVIGSLWGALFSPYGPLADLVNHLNQAQFQAHLAGVFGAATTFQPTDTVLRGIVDAAGGFDALAKAGVGSNLDDLRAFLGTYGPDQLPTLKADLANLFAPTFSAASMDQPDVAMLPILFVTLWQWTGFYLILFLANMQRIDTQIIEAAQIDGATEGQVLRHIILPSLSGVLVTTAILAISGSLKSFDLIWAMNGDKLATQVLSVYTYRTAFSAAPDYPLANAISTVMVALSFVLIGLTRAVEHRFGGKE